MPLSVVFSVHNCISFLLDNIIARFFIIIFIIIIWPDCHGAGNFADSKVH